MQIVTGKRGGRVSRYTVLTYVVSVRSLFLFSPGEWLGAVTHNFEPAPPLRSDARVCTEQRYGPGRYDMSLPI